MEKLTNAASSSIRMGEMSVANDGDLLRTLLGSCIGLALFDRQRKVGGLAHIVLPSARGKTDSPGKFADTAIPKLIEDMESLAGVELKLTAKMAGGACMFSKSAAANIGSQNTETCERLLGELGIPIVAKHCGGSKGRRMSLDTGNGRVVIEIVGQAPIEL